MSHRIFSHIMKTLLSSAAFILIFTATGCSGWFDSSVTISGTKYPPDTESIVLSDYQTDDYSAFAQLKNLKTLDVTALSLSTEDYEKIRFQVAPEVDIIWSVPLSIGSFSSHSEELTLSGPVCDQDAHNIEYFSALQNLTVHDTEINENLATLLTTVSENNPDVDINCSSSIYGVKIDRTTELLDLNEIPIQSPDQLCLAIELFPNVRTIEMCDCGLRNEIMQGLREEYPDIKFVWKISFLNYRVRTDIQVFSTLAFNANRSATSKSFQPLFRYCTELRALDLGHMAITDISEISNLKKLHTLILADNQISDISPLAELKELVYIELFQNRIRDVSPLLELPNLEDLNLCYNGRMENPTVLTGCQKLKRLYISHCSLDSDEISELRKGIPEGCEYNYTAPNCVHSGWRTTANARNTKIREAFKNWRKVKEYPTWDNIVYQ